MLGGEREIIFSPFISPPITNGAPQTCASSLNGASPRRQRAYTGFHWREQHPVQVAHIRCHPSLIHHAPASPNPFHPLWTYLSWWVFLIPLMFMGPLQPLWQHYESMQVPAWPFATNIRLAKIYFWQSNKIGLLSGLF